MATWKDGAAYAPLERPDGFATPVADPLPAAEPYSAKTPGPLQHPGGFDAAPQPPLAELGATEQRGRDPRDSFKVSSMALTMAPGHATGRDPRQPFANTFTPVVAPGPPPPTGPPLAPPGWAPLPPAPVTAPQTETLAWVCAALTFGGFVLSGGAVILLLVTGAIGWRANARHRWLAVVSLIAGALMALVQLGLGSFGEAGLLPSLVSLGVCIGFVVSILRGAPAASNR